MRMLGAHRDVVAEGSPSDHPDIDVLTRHGTGQLSARKARAVSAHLLVCEDGRCVAFVRAGVEDVDAAARLLYPEGEASRMHARTFLCREALWAAFEDIAREERAPIDDVLSDAMRAYARQRSYGVPGEPSAESERATNAHNYQAENAPDLARTGAVVRQPTQRMAAPTAEAPSMRRAMPAPPSMRGMPPPPQAAIPAAPSRVQRPFTQPFGQVLPAPPPPRSGVARPMQGAPPPSMRGGGGMPMAPPGRSAAPPPLPAADPMMPAYGVVGRGRAPATLVLTYNGRPLDVTKERFILGRSKAQADLVLDDPNVSRQHAAIEQVGDAWFLADLGSTNGCYIGGQRVSRRQIVEGDVIEITTHQIHCSFR
jgi:hypothetical protein